MNGMEIARSYFREYGQDMIERKLYPYKNEIAAGLVGEGSERFGFDDELSQDHDFGAGFCIWIPESLYASSGEEISRAYDELPESYMGYRRICTPQGTGRVGVLTIEGFYRKFTGLGDAPKDNLEWFRIPERFLATATNGEVFVDYNGEFTRIRAALKKFYPDDVLKKKLAARCAIMAQSGQYNYPRCIKRGDSQAAYLACAEFVRAVLSTIYLLNGTYMPYYKWTFRGMRSFTILNNAADNLRELTTLSDSVQMHAKKQELIENICIEIGRELNRRGFTNTTDAWLQTHGEKLMRGIDDARLSGMHIMADCN